jgi:signal transduction histidine kinase
MGEPADLTRYPRPEDTLPLRPAASRYLGAFVAVALAVYVADWLDSVLDPSVVLLAAVVVAAWFSGFWPAMLASVLATLALDYFFTTPVHVLRVDIVHVPRLAVFTVIAGVFVAVSARRRSAEQSLQRIRDRLDATVRERTATLHEQAEALEQLAGRLIRAQEEERSRIGRELHDHISQMLGVLTIRMDQLRADEATPPAIAAVLEELRRSTTEITSDIHSLSHRLHSSALDYLGLVPGLQRLVTEFASRYGIDIEFDHADIPAALPSDAALCLFRITEEGLTNIARHSGAKFARVHVHGEADGIHLTIEDSGVGFDMAARERKPGLGIISMRERLRALKGTVRMDSAPGRGTRIDVMIPASSLTTSSGDAAPPQVARTM